LFVRGAPKACKAGIRQKSKVLTKTLAEHVQIAQRVELDANQIVAG